MKDGEEFVISGIRGVKREKASRTRTTDAGVVEKRLQSTLKVNTEGWRLVLSLASFLNIVTYFADGHLSKSIWWFS